jgi:hypothetical protein
MLEHALDVAVPRLPELVDGRTRELVVLEVRRLGE